MNKLRNNGSNYKRKIANWAIMKLRSLDGEQDNDRFFKLDVGDKIHDEEIINKLNEIIDNKAEPYIKIWSVKLSNKKIKREIIGNSKKTIQTQKSKKFALKINKSKIFNFLIVAFLKTIIWFLH